MSFNHIIEIEEKIGKMLVSIPLSRVNVFQSQIKNGDISQAIVQRFNPLKSGQCLSIKMEKVIYRFSQ